MSEARLKRYEKWASAAAIFFSLQVTGYLQNMHGVHGGVPFVVAMLAPFGVALLGMQWLKSWARRAPVSHEWPAIAGVATAALGLRSRWWTSPVQIGRAWLISGVGVGAVAFALYRELPTAAFAAATLPALALGASWWRHRKTSAGPALPVSGWYADPARRHEQRYWDGEGWTQFVVDAGTQSVDPPR